MRVRRSPTGVPIGLAAEWAIGILLAVAFAAYRLWQALTGGATARTEADLTDDDRLLEQLFGPRNPTPQGENQ